MTGHRYPLEALLAATGYSENELSRHIGISGSTLKLARERGFVQAAAERYATRAGLPPLAVWPEMIEHNIAASQVPCLECSEPFIPSRPSHRYCSKNCRERRRMRVAYQTDPTRAARSRARRRAYYAECADYERAQSKKRYWTDPERHREATRERRRRAKEAA